MSHSVCIITSDRVGMFLIMVSVITCMVASTAFFVMYYDNADTIMQAFAQSNMFDTTVATLQYGSNVNTNDHKNTMTSTYGKTIPAMSLVPQWSLYTEEPPLYRENSDIDKYAQYVFDTAILEFDSEFFQTINVNAPKRYLVFGAAATADSYTASLQHASKLINSNTIQMMPNDGFFSLALLSQESASELASNGFLVIPDRPLDFHKLNSYGTHAEFDFSSTVENDLVEYVNSFDVISDNNIYENNDKTPHFTSAPNITSLSKSTLNNSAIQDATNIPTIIGLDSDDAAKYNATGKGITIAIVDTGVDFSNPDIQHSLARDSITNHPIMLDPDGQGIVITNKTFYANIDQDGVLRNYHGEIPLGFDSVVYTTQDGVFLDIEQNGNGTTLSVYNSLYPLVGDAPIFNGTLDKDMKIGNNNRDYIKSQSGSYRLGAIFQMSPTGLGPGDIAKAQVVPVLVVDSTTPGIYDMIIPDMSSSWIDYMHEPGTVPNFDLDFTDETPIILGSGNEFLVYDSDDDGMTDYSVGTAGARVLDVFSVINATLLSHYDENIQAVNGTLLPALDPDGRFFGIMTDSAGHGTSSSATITSAGQMKYDIYNDTNSYVIKGVAPDAKILPVKALWLGDVVYGWLWSAGFDNHNSSWTFSGIPRADIISNSWGVSTFPNMGAAPGYDILSLVLDMLATPRSFDEDYPGVVMISSAGNSGHGYGTLGIPGVASFSISVGASTNNVFVGYGPFKDQPRFGTTIIASNSDDTEIHHNNGHVVDFSSRGPGVIGDIRPDVVSMGAFGFVPRNMMGASQNANTQDPFTLFGGTSMAAPMVAGASALIMSELTENLMDYDSFIVRNILMSTARDTHNDPFVQGTGLADVGTALDFVHGNNGVFIVYNDDSYQQIRNILQPAISSANITDTGIGVFELPDRNIPMTTWFAGHLQPSERTTATFKIENPNSEIITVDVSPQIMSLIQHTKYDGTTITHQQDSILNDTDAYIPNYVRLADVYSDDELGGLLDDGSMPFPDNASLLVLNVNFEFSDFMNMTTDVYADDLGIASLYLYDWVDENNDSEISSNELLLVTRGGSWGTVQEIRISDPATKFEGVPTVGIYPVPQKYSYWIGPTGINSTLLDYTISANYYTKETWRDVIWPADNTISVNPQDVGEIDITLVTTSDTAVGVHQGFIEFKSDDHTVNVPVSFVIQSSVHDANSEIVVNPDATLSVIPVDDNDDLTALLGVLYNNGYTRGSFDVVDRYMTGDWRNYYFDVYDESITSASVEISWQSPNTSMSAFAINPAGRIIQTNVPSGVFGHFLDWPSVDWLGVTPFSEGGGFYPVSGNSKDNPSTSTFMTVPINGSGTYVIMTHTTLFGGESTIEPISITLKFYTDVSNDNAVVNNSENHVDGIDSVMPAKDESLYNVPVEDFDHNNEIKNTTILDTGDNTSFSNATSVESNSTVISDNDIILSDIPESTDIQNQFDSTFGVGIIIGIAFGVAIGVIVSFIMLRRSKNTTTAFEHHDKSDTIHDSNANSVNSILNPNRHWSQ